jgi:hypothetical protein
MENEFSLISTNMQKLQTSIELRQCNEMTAKFGLYLTESQIKSIVNKRFEALKNTGRIEFGKGIIKKLIYEFCDSPFIDKRNYEDILLELLDSFYYFKNESMDLISDDELISFMKKHFDEVCQGSIEYLNSTSLEDLCRNTRYGYEIDDKDIYGNPF